MSTLMSFMLDTLQPRLNDPENAKLWLPRLLGQMEDDEGIPVLPIESAEQDLGLLQGEHGDFVADTFAKSWSVFNMKPAEPDPQRPHPALKLFDVKVSGLQNMRVQKVSSQVTANGYAVSVELLPNHYPDPSQGLEMPPFSLSGRYLINQSLWADESYIEQIKGEGEFTALFQDCVVNALLTLETTGEAEQRSTVVTLKGLVLSGNAEEMPILQFDDLTLEGDLELAEALIMYIKMALNGEDGQASMLDTVASLLNHTDNLASISISLSDYLGSGLDHFFGAVPEHGLPDDADNQQGNTPLDVYLFDRLRIAFNQSGSNWYLPQLLTESNDPTIEPYTHDHISIPDQNIQGLNYTEIELTHLTLAGLSNAYVPLSTWVLTSPAMRMDVELGVLPEGHAGVPPAPPVKLNTDISLVQNGWVEPVHIKGHVSAHLMDSHMLLNVLMSGTDSNDLYLTVTELELLWGAAPVEFSVALVPRNSLLEGLIAGMLKKPEVQAPIMAELAEAIGNQRPELSDNFTLLVRAALNNQLS